MSVFGKSVSAERLSGLLETIINRDISLWSGLAIKGELNKKVIMMSVVEYMQKIMMDISLNNKETVNRIEVSYNYRDGNIYLFIKDENDACFNINSDYEVNGDKVTLGFLKDAVNFGVIRQGRTIDKEDIDKLRVILEHFNAHKKKYRVFFKVKKSTLTVGCMLIDFGVNRYVEKSDGSPIIEMNMGLASFSNILLTSSDVSTYKNLQKVNDAYIEKIIMESDVKDLNIKESSRRVKL